MDADENQARAAYQILRFDNSGSVLRDHKTRQYFKKTRSGCLPCREKRVKDLLETSYMVRLTADVPEQCDEGRPICARCKRNSRECRFALPYGTRNDSTQMSKSRTANTTTRGTPMSSSAPTRPLPPSTVTLPNLFQLPSQDPRNGASGQHLMAHFCQNSEEVFRMRRVEDIVSLSSSDPLVCSSVLALAASHLRHASGDHVLEYRVAELFHQSRAIKALQEMLAAPRDSLNEVTVNGLLMSAMMLNMMAMTLSKRESGSLVKTGEEKPQDSGNRRAGDIVDDRNTSWVFSDRDDRLDWLGLQAGIRPLLLSVPAYIDSAVRFLSPIFMGEQDKWSSSQIHLERCLSLVSPTWARIFELDRRDNTPGCETKSSRSPDTFRNAVLFLSELRILKHSGGFGIFRTLPFLSKVVGPFRTRLFERDERAMWLFGYWLGLLCRFEDVWWCDKRARKDYTDVRRWLDGRRLIERTGEEGTMWKELMEELAAAPVVNGVSGVDF